jgi:peptidoglycan hydrolase CwlO-like protein
LERRSKVKAMIHQYIIFGMGIVIVIIGFFLASFYNSMTNGLEEIKKGVNKIMIQTATQESDIHNVKDKINDVIEKQQDHGKWLQQLELEITKLKK